MRTLDYAYLCLIVVWLLLDHFVLWSRFQRHVHANPGRARWRLWSAWMTMMWALTGAGMAWWWIAGRPWADLRFALPHGWRFALAIAVVTVLAAMQAGSIRRIAKLPGDRPVRFGSGNDVLAPMLPHTRKEFGGFVALSLTAGFCEEFIFRGYLIWAFQASLGAWGAAALSSVAFGLAHAYQGARGILSTAIVGALLAVLVLLTGSLWPAIVVHALLDIGQGWVAWLVLRRAGNQPAPAGGTKRPG